MKYEDKTSRWIAIEVAKRLGKRVSTVTEFHEGDGCVVYPHNNQINFDPCNSPSDAWPIMIDNNIFITATREDHEFKYMTKCLINGSAGLGWAARFTEYSDNPLRAAMICFLKMKDAEK